MIDCLFCGAGFEPLTDEDVCNHCRLRALAEMRGYASRPLPDGREVSVMPLTYGRARLTIGGQGSGWYDDGW